MMKKKKYTLFEMETIEFEEKDIITDSGDDSSEDDSDPYELPFIPVE